MKTFPVMEVFGPTVQGEGPLAGQLSHFVRFGACDYRCVWCDSLHAVIPEQVRANAERLDAISIARRVEELAPSAPWVTLSGGNPALHKLEDVVRELHVSCKVAVETQGSLWRDWLYDVDMLIVSPKPPSSLMVSKAHARQWEQFQARTHRIPSAFKSYKGVVFSLEDYEWHRKNMDWLHGEGWDNLYLSAGTDLFHGESLKDTRNGVGTSYARLCDWIVADPLMPDTVRVFPQLHVIAWGHKRGV